MATEKDVHTEHCCAVHGCKYGDEDCTVVEKLRPQSYLCEDCLWALEHTEEIRASLDRILTLVKGIDTNVRAILR